MTKNNNVKIETSQEWQCWAKTRGELFPEDILTDAKYVQEGKVTEEGIAELRKRMPFANLDEFAKKPIVQDFGNLLTVADMCRFVESKVEVSD